MFKHPFSFDGRIGRAEYAITCLLCLPFQVILEVLPDEDISFLFFLLYIPVLWIQFAQGAKRCHDLDRVAWWQIVPFYGFVMLFKAGDDGANEYGFPNSHPKDAPVSSLEKEIDSIGQKDVH